MKILVFGKTGQVATELRAQATVTALGRDQADLADPSACARLVAGCDADIVINAAAFTAVDAAESNQAAATLINADAPAAMARAAAARDIPFLHFSTDYVFDGAGATPHRPDDPTAPLNAYGRSKLAGEAGIRAAGGRHLILRTSWVFSPHGSNFVKTILRLCETRDTLAIVDDQVGGPTPADDIAATALTLARTMLDGHPGGTYHYTGLPTVSWADFAREIAAQAGKPVSVSGIPTSDYPTPARRPLNSRLDCATLETDFGIKPSDWKAGLARTLDILSRT